MNRFSCILALMSVLAVQNARGEVKEGLDGAFLRQLQERDSVLIADQLEYGFLLEGVEAGTVFALPDYTGGFRDSVEVLTPWRLDTLDVRKGKDGAASLLDLRGSVVITSFDEGSYDLPPIPLMRKTPDGTTDTLVFSPMVLEVKTMPVDTATFAIHDIKGQVRYPLTFRELFPYLAGGQLAVVLAILTVCLVMMRKRDSEVAGRRKEPAHILALRKLDRLRGNKLWLAEKQKTFYSGVTDTLREYIVSRYGISALEMTTREIFDRLSGKDIPQDIYEEVRTLFERADYVKFAKYVATDEENASAVPAAVRFVTQTYQVELDPEMPAEGDAPAERKEK